MFLGRKSPRSVCRIRHTGHRTKNPPRDQQMRIRSTILELPPGDIAPQNLRWPAAGKVGGWESEKLGRVLVTRERARRHGGRRDWRAGRAYVWILARVARRREDREGDCAIWRGIGGGWWLLGSQTGRCERSWTGHPAHAYGTAIWLYPGGGRLGVVPRAFHRPLCSIRAGIECRIGPRVALRFTCGYIPAPRWG